MKKLFFLLLLPAFMFSCQKEELAPVEIDEILTDLDLKSDNDESKDSKCYEILFPLKVEMPDGTILSGENKKDLMKEIKSWIRQNGKTRRKEISLHFPLEVNFQGKVLGLENERQLVRLRMACRGEGRVLGDKVPCIEMIFPISYELPTGRIFTANNASELRTFMDTWKKQHTDSRVSPGMVYPVDIKFKGKELTIKSEREMMRVKNACKGK